MASGSPLIFTPIGRPSGVSLFTNSSGSMSGPIEIAVDSPSRVSMSSGKDSPVSASASSRNSSTSASVPM